MNISFSTTNEHNAKKYLWSDAYSYLNEEAKQLALDFCIKGKLRVQDPLMYSSPRLEITDQEVYDSIMKAMLK